MRSFRQLALCAALYAPWAFLLAGAAALSGPACAAEFRWAAPQDAATLDPHLRNDAATGALVQNIYEPLARLGRDFTLEPALAVSWEQPDPLTWRFHLRPGVTFQGGEPFTADDVVFSYQRAAGPGGGLKIYFQHVKDIRAVDRLTVDIDMNTQDPMLPDTLVNWVIMSKAWCEAHGAAQGADIAKGEDNYATMHADGTGPFAVATREPDRRTVFVPNPGWWDHPAHNITRATMDIIGNPSTRVAALISGATDMIHTLPLQDVPRIEASPELKVLSVPDMRIISLGFDQFRDVLPDSGVAGNPFKDRRVRLAIYKAIDIKAITTRLMRGLARPVGLLYGPKETGYEAALDTREAFDPDGARQLLTEAGYPHGFGTPLDCPNGQYVNDAETCQAIASMLARIGVKVSINLLPPTQFFTQIAPPDFKTSFFLSGYTSPNHFAGSTMMIRAGSYDGNRGMSNNGRYSNPAVDKLLASSVIETDVAKRNRMVADATRLLKDDVAYVPLHQQYALWAARKTIDLVQFPNNLFPLRYVVVHP